MCTVVVRWHPGRPARVLALRDELTSRSFDDPAEHWTPGVVGGRDRTAGGTWCASDVTAGTTALVLNRPHKRVADDGAPSRGVLPLVAVGEGERWTEHVEVAGMASFALVLVAPDRLSLWEFDGAALSSTALGPGTHMVTSGGAEDGKAERYLRRFTGDDWLSVVTHELPEDDPTSLVVRHAEGDKVFATVFGQLIDQSAGRLHLEHSRTPWVPDGWTAQDF